MTHPIPPLALVALSLLSVGCGSLQYQVPGIITDANQPGTAGDKINPYTFNPAKQDPPLYRQALEGSDENAERARNEIQTAIIGLSDSVISEYYAKIKSTHDWAEIIFGATGLGLDAASAAVTGLTLKTALSAAAGAIKGTGAVVEKEVFQNTVVPAVLLAIRTSRDEEKSKMRTRRRDSTKNYGVGEAIADAMAYHEMGSFYRGLELVVQASHDKDNKRTGVATRLTSALDPRTIDPDTGLPVAELKERIEKVRERLAALTAAEVSKKLSADFVRSAIESIDGSHKVAGTRLMETQLQSTDEDTKAQGVRAAILFLSQKQGRPRSLGSDHGR